MKRWKKRALYGLGALLPLGLGLWLAAPSIVRWQVHKRHPEVTFTEVDVGWRKATLHQVSIDKGWIKVTADYAVIDTKSEGVHLVHGHVDADLDKRPEHHESTKTDQPNVTAEDFSLSVVSVQHDLSATLTGVSVTETTVTAGEGDVRYKGYRVGLGSLGTPLPAVEVTRDFKHVKIGGIGFPYGLELPAPAPAIVHPGLTGVDIDLEKRTMDVNSGGFELAEDQGIEVQVQWAHLALDGEKVQVRLHNLYVSHPRLSSPGDGPVDFEDVAFDVGRDWKQPIDVKLKDATFHVDPVTKSVSGDELCSTWVKALPSGMADPPIRGRTQWGIQPKLSRIEFSLGVLPKPHFSLSGNCSATCDDPELVALRHKFSYHTYNEKGERVETPRTTGPDEPDWVPLSQISENMLDAVANMEDWGFWSHHGYVASALEQSFIEDVKTDKFSRGGSTVTMQTAKNIFLSRDKTIGRKVSELFLSQVLESCFSKKEIMELYLNVVEFGPNVYGLRQAASHYFKTEPMQLGPQEAFYLAWILPRPRKSPPPNAATLARVTALMQMLAKNGRITEAQMLSISPPDTTGWAQP